jgi:hypothetical protein
MDDTLKLFDIRNFTAPVSTVSNLPNFFEHTNTAFSPDQKFILTGTSTKKNEGSGKIVIFRSENLERVKELDMGPASCVKLEWHSRINQVFAGLSDGSVQVLYSPYSSVSGIKLAVGKEVKQRAVDDIAYSTVPIEVKPKSERPLFPEERVSDYKKDFGTSKPKRKDKIDPRDLRKPFVPLRGGSAGIGGQIGTSVQSSMMKSMIQDKRYLSEDPREAILKYAEIAEKDPYWVAPAYKESQPKPQLAEGVYLNEEEAKREAKKRRRQ